MEEFLENYPETRASLRAQLKTRETDIRGLLESTAKNLDIEKKHLDRGEFEEMGKELDFKQAQTKNAQHTLARVKQELLRRRTDFLKVTQFERLFPEKIKGLRERLANLKRDLATFENVEQETQFLGGSIETLQRQLEEYEGFEAQSKTGLVNAENHFKDQLNELQMHPAFRKFLNSEKRLIQSEKLLASIENYIRRERESQNIQPVLRDISEQFSLLNQLNKASL